jgi:hypothetical protein
MTVSSIASNSRGLVFDAKLMAAYNTMTVIIALSVFYSLYSPQADGYRAKGRRYVQFRVQGHIANTKPQQGSPC